MSEESMTVGWLRPAEHAFYRRALDYVQYVQAEQNWRLTDFLSPRELQILESVARREGCVVAAYGGAPECERVRTYVMPAQWQPQASDFAVSVLHVSTLDGILTHGALLGSLLGTGIDRRKIGDIEVKGEDAIVAVCDDIVSFLTQHWTHVGRHVVSLSVTDNVQFTGPRYEEAQVSLASMRLDALVGACCHWSRTKAKEAIAHGDVTLNFTPTEAADEAVTGGDIISVRHFGRIRIFEALGESKKGRVRLQVGILKSKA